MITPHGGTLVSRIVPAEERASLRESAATLPVVDLNAREASDLLLIAIGAMSPLEGFMCREEYEAVLDRMRLPSGLPWSLPVTLGAAASALRGQTPPFLVALRSPDGSLAGTMTVEDMYTPDKSREARAALGTEDPQHPGVQYLQGSGEIYLGGKVRLFERSKAGPFEAHERDPMETRALFAEKKWDRVCAFQTRNPIHRAHEYLIKCALETMDGFLIHPAMGETKSDDIPASARMECYLALTENYFPASHVSLSVFPYAMRYAGPREAILHAILRRNYGCSHFIVGRDHAGVGNYYGTYDAQRNFSNFDAGEIGITPVFFEHSFYCRRCGGMASDKTCPHGATERVALSGTKVRELLASGTPLPVEFTRREVSAILERFYAGGRAA